MTNAGMDHVADRTAAYVHRAKKLMLDLFGQEAAHDQPTITLHLVEAMIQLETAETMAALLRELKQTSADKER